MTERKMVTIETRVPRIKAEKRKRRPNGKLIAIIFVFFIAISLVLYFEFSLGRIAHIEVTGNYLLSQREIVSLSGIGENDSFLALSTNGIREKIIANPEVKDVEVHKIFPNRVTINVREFKVIGYLVNEGTLTPLLENGRIATDRAVENKPVHNILLQGFEQGEELQELAAELSLLSPSIRNSVSEIHYTPTELNRQLIYVYTSEGFKVIASIRNFSESMLTYPSIIQNLEGRGVIDMEADGAFFTPSE